MKKEEIGYVPPISFKEQTPQIYIGQQPADTLYEKEFLSCGADKCGEFCKNTSTWD